MPKSDSSKSKPIATVLLSGGLDSAAVAHFLIRQGVNVSAIFVNYGQAAIIDERKASKAVARALGIPLQEINLPSPKRFTSGELVGRNTFLLFAAIFLGRVHAGIITMGLHAGTLYYDCSKSYIESIAALIREHTDGRLQFVAPFANWSKQDVFDYFKSNKLPRHLTYSCETGGAEICGICASCRDLEKLKC